MVPLVEMKIPLGQISGISPPIGIVKHPSNKALKGLIAGAVSGVVEMAINFPTDYVKTQLQLDEKSTQRRYTGMLDVIKQTVRRHGVQGLYRGLNVAIWNPKVAVRFAAFESFRKIAVDERGQLTSGRLLLCGMAAGCCEAILAVTPIESVKVKFVDDQNSPKQRYKGLFHGIRTIVKDHGLRGLYQGSTATIIKSVTNQGTRFFVIESLKNWHRKRNSGQPVPTYMVLLFGAIGGAMSVVITAPADVVRTRMQGLQSHKYRSTLHCVRTLLKHEGPASLFAGVIPRMVKVPLETAIVFAVYGKVVELLDSVW
ncbi:Tricarboxylate transport protein, mitochondrial [Hypsibius exemplaris]|uniref:Citrate transport protein n=1 Tax=Hypsibius exemplaris TaxID=2072580 RepID=A0A9X6NGM4_HYPEX|nr:Tricarboxylate transport protein, mitochondrial [Hypsibius exemplaris]